MKCSQNILDVKKIQDQAIRIWEWTMQLLQFLHGRNLHPKDMWRSLLASSVSVHGKALCIDKVLPGGWSDTIRRIFWSTVNQEPWSSMGL